MIEIGEKGLNGAVDLLKAIYTDSPIGIEIYDSKGKLIDLNQSCMELFGVSRKEDVKGFDLFNDPNIPIDHLTKLRQRESVRYESIFDFDLVKKQSLYKTSKSGRIYLDVLITPLFIEENKSISNYLVQIQDNSERKIGEHKLIDLNEFLEKKVEERTKKIRKSEEDWRFLVEEAPDIILTVDCNRVILYINKVPQGLTQEQAIGTDVLDYVDPNYHETVINSIERVFQTGKSDRYEISARGPNDSISWYSTRLGAIKQNNEVVSVMLITRDITERKKVEQKLRESEEKYRLITENANDMICVLNHKYRYEYINEQSYLKFLGYANEELIGKSAWKLVHHEDINRYLKEINGKGDVDENKTELRFKHKSGNWVWLQVTIRRFRDKNSGKNRYLLVSREITQQKQAENELKESEQRYRRLIENISDIIFELDLEGKITYLSPHSTDMIGYKPDELIDQNAFKFIHPDDLEEVLKNQKYTATTGEVGSVEFRIQHKNGHYVTVSSRGQLIERNNKKKIVGLFRDITERKLIEKQVQQEIDKAEMYLNLVNVIIVALDKDGNIVMINQKGNDILGWNKGELIGENWFENCIPSQDRERVKEYFKKLVKGEVDVVPFYENSVLTKKGEEKLIAWSTILFRDSNGKIQGTVSSGEDITERKKAEEKIFDSEKRLKNLIEAVPVGISITIPEGKIIECNSTSFQNFGYNSKEEFFGTPVIDLYRLPSDRERFVKLIKSGFVKDFEAEFKRKDGSIFWGSLTSIAQKVGDQITLINSFQDITDRKLTEIKIQQNEAELTAIYNYTPIAILLVDSERKIKKINKFALKFTDRQEEEVLGIQGGQALRCLYSITDPKGCGFSEQCQDCTIRNTILDTFKTKIPHINVEATLHLLPGSNTDIVHLLISSVPLIFDGEDLVLISLIDISDRMKAEQKLKESEERYRELFENSPIALFEQDFSELKSYLNTLEASGTVNFEKYFDENPEEILNCGSMIKIVDVNMNALEIYKANSMEEFVGRKNQIEKSLYRNISPELLLVNKRELLSFINGDKTFESESVTTSLTGDMIYVYMKTEIIPGFEKTWSKVIVSILDITNRKKIEQKLRESEEKFRTIAEQSSIGVIIQQGGFIIFANNAVSEINEYPMEEINNQPVESIYKMVYEEDLPLMSEKFKEREDGDYESVNQFELRLLSKTGKIKWVSIFTKPIIYLGENAILSTLIDVTDKKLVEEELREVSRLKSDLLSRTSHELKTPLVSIKGYADLLLSQHYDALDYYTISVLHEIKQGCSRLESLIKDLIESSKLESGEIELDKSEEDLAFLIKFCIKDLQGLLEMRNHKLILEIQENLKSFFEKERIYDVVINLLSNAIKYTPSGGTIKINSEIKKGFYIISIKDDGIGLTKDEMSKIFKKFGKIERYGKGLDVISEGSGLGLYISKNIVELHGGNTWVESKGRDKGSTFYFSLPIITK